jgi:HSP20 family protein
MSIHATETSSPPSRSLPQHRREATLAPPVDILESSDGITLQADMPGVSKERLQVRVEGDNLLLEGTLLLDVPESAHPAHADVRSSTYLRRFVLSRELETDKIEASLKDGVLTVHIPRRAELRPRTIEVRS